MKLRQVWAALAATALCAGTLTACTDADPGSQAAATAVPDSLEQARTENRAHNVDQRFGSAPTVVADPTNSGVEATKIFFESSETAVVSGPSDADQLRAASLAITAHAPVLRWTPDTAEKVTAELHRLGVGKILAVGEVDPAGVDSAFGTDAQVIVDPGTSAALSDLTSLEFGHEEVNTPAQMVAAAAKFDAKNPVELQAVWEPRPAQEEATSTATQERVAAFPVQSAQDGQVAPVVVAAPQSSVIEVATARAYGTTIRVMDYPDPRINETAHKMVVGLDDQPLIALGAGFGDSQQLSRKIQLADQASAKGQELPGGGNLVFPGRRMIALYGHPSGGALGVMGERDPQGSVDYVKDLVAQYQPLEPDQKIIPAFEIIATVASEFPGEDGDYSNEADPEELIPYIDAIVAAGGYAVLDLQPGRANFLDQAKRYEELLKRPNVGLALDAEWRIGPDEAPLSRVGHVEAAEVNETSEWLARLVSDNQLPQKAFVLHQFQLQMLPDRDNIRTDHPELAYVLHADGHGVAEEKFGTWNAMLQGLNPSWFMAWKNFFDEDKPMFTPQQTYDVAPRPWFVSYQ